MGKWIDGIMGLVVADALGVPVEFKSREEIRKDPVKGMRGYGTYDLPAGSWSDDSSMTLATLDSICQCDGIDYKDIMDRFIRWDDEGDYTPYGTAFDIGCTCSEALFHYAFGNDPMTCGCVDEWSNGNGSLMRILPVCLYAYEQEVNGVISNEDAYDIIHKVSSLTHAHIRSKIACGIYYEMVKALLSKNGLLTNALQDAVNRAVHYYREKNISE